MLQGQNIGENRSLVRHLFTNLLNRIVSSSQHFPLPLRLICTRIYKHTSTRHSESAALSAVSSFLFLQFIVPTLTWPQRIAKFGEQQMPRAVQRGLVLLSKMLRILSQNISQSREAYMQYMDSFVTRKKEAFDGFLKASTPH